MSNLSEAPVTKRITSVVTLHFDDMVKPPAIRVGDESEPRILSEAVITLLAHTIATSITWTWYDDNAVPTSWHGRVNDLVDVDDRQDMQRIIDEARAELDRMKR